MPDEAAQIVKAVFLDRDGVINADRDDYVKSLSELQVFPFVPAAIRALNASGWPVIVVSNQQGIAKGIVSEADLYEMEHEIRRQVEMVGGRIEAFYYCKHLASDDCDCRKPRPGLILQAAREKGVDVAQSVMVGDSERDIIAGKAAGCMTALVLTGKLRREDVGNLSCKPDFVAEHLGDAAQQILEPEL